MYPKTAPEMRYAMLHGTFTTESQPYHCRSGWLGYIVRDALWSPAWNMAKVAGSVEAIMNNVKLRMNKVVLDPKHLLYIDSRGVYGVIPECFLRSR